jgi:hypothetical protein
MDLNCAVCSERHSLYSTLLGPFKISGCRKPMVPGCSDLQAAAVAAGGETLELHEAM